MSEIWQFDYPDYNDHTAELYHTLMEIEKYLDENMEITNPLRSKFISVLEEVEGVFQEP